MKRNCFICVSISFYRAFVFPLRIQRKKSQLILMAFRIIRSLMGFRSNYSIDRRVKFCEPVIWSVSWLSSRLCVYIERQES